MYEYFKKETSWFENCLQETVVCQIYVVFFCEDIFISDNLYYLI